MCWAPGTTESGGGERQGGGAEEQLRGEGEDASQSAREPARAVDCAATAGGFQQNSHQTTPIALLHNDAMKQINRKSETLVNLVSDCTTREAS